MRKFTLLGALMAVFWVIQPVQAGLYKWIDEDGNVVYSERKPPAGTQVEALEKKSSGISDEESESALQELRDRVDAAEEDRAIKDDIARQQTERDDTIKKNCEIARKNKSLLETPARVTLKDEDGNDYFLEEAQRQQKLLDATAQVERYCTD